MANDDIQGTVLDEAGNPIEGAIVELTLSNGDSGDGAVYTTTDANGDFIFEGHPQGDGTSKEWHIKTYYEDGGGAYNVRSRPKVSAALPEGGLIPDSAASQFKFDEGSGTTLTNEFSGQPDATINGAGWISDGDLVSGFGLDFGGGSDYIEINSNYGFVDGSSQFSFAKTINLENADFDEMVWNQSDGSNYIFAVNVSANTSGDITAGYFDGSAWMFERSISPSSPTSRLRLGVAFDPINDDANLFINGSQLSDSDDSGGANGSLTSGNYIGAKTNDLDYASMVGDNPVWYDTILTESDFQQDYDAQPWS
jgi:hypothetical protein